MSGPDDIPDDIMSAAISAFDNAPTTQGHYETIARAILAAKAEERAACLLIIAREQFNRRAQSDDEPQKVKRMALNSMAFVCEVLMEAITARGEG